MIYVNEKEYNAICDAATEIEGQIEGCDGGTDENIELIELYNEILRGLNSLIKKCKKDYQKRRK